MTLFKRGKIWWAYVTVNGVRHAKSTETSNRRLAERVDQDYRDELRVRRFQPPEFNPEMLFDELAAKFLAEGNAKAWHVDRLKPLLPFFGRIEIGHINRNLALEYRAYRHRQKTISETTVNRDLEAARRIFSWAVDAGILPRNPFMRVPMIRERRKRRSVMSVVEEDLLLGACSPHLRFMVIAALDSGMRRGELLHQRWEDIDFPRRLLFVTHSKTPEGECREIPLSTRLQDLLWNKRKNTGPVFTFDGEVITSVKTAWKGALRRSAIRTYRFHDLRHTFNTRLMEAGVMQETRKALMGHSSGEDVNSIYTHVELPQKREAIRKLEEWIKAQRAELEREREKQKEADETNGRSQASGVRESEHHSLGNDGDARGGPTAPSGG